jgi:hypothetical protein
MDLIRLYLNNAYFLVLELSPWVTSSTVLLAIWAVYRAWKLRHFHLVCLDITLGGIGKVELRPNLEDIQVAHRIWVELITRKAALPIDPEHDVIVEIYDSWYALFLRVRQLIGDIPAQLVRKEKSTQELVRIATETLNKGLRPHLTRWQAQLRNWYVQERDQLKTKTPQELQRLFPQYIDLITDLQLVNQQLIQYAGELQKIVRG